MKSDLSSKLSAADKAALVDAAASFALVGRLTEATNACARGDHTTALGLAVDAAVELQHLCGAAPGVSKEAVSELRRRVPAAEEARELRALALELERRVGVFVDDPHLAAVVGEISGRAKATAERLERQATTTVPPTAQAKALRELAEWAAHCAEELAGQEWVRLDLIAGQTEQVAERLEAEAAAQPVHEVRDCGWCPAFDTEDERCRLDYTIDTIGASFRGVPGRCPLRGGGLLLRLADGA